jgi:hypothetical protein
MLYFFDAQRIADASVYSGFHNLTARARTRFLVEYRLRPMSSFGSAANWLCWRRRSSIHRA